MAGDIVLLDFDSFAFILLLFSVIVMRLVEGASDLNCAKIVGQLYIEYPQVIPK